VKGKLIFSPKRGFPARIPRSLVRRILKRNCPNSSLAGLAKLLEFSYNKTEKIFAGVVELVDALDPKIQFNRLFKSPLKQQIPHQ